MDYYTKMYSNMQALFLLFVNQEFSITVTIKYNIISLKKKWKKFDFFRDNLLFYIEKYGLAQLLIVRSTLMF